MRLFGKVNSQIDRYDRAQWLTGPFDAPVQLLIGPLAVRVIAGYFGYRLARPALAGRDGLQLASAALAGRDGLQLASAAKAGRDGLQLAHSAFAGRKNTREP
jgi:hypothetical protein